MIWNIEGADAATGEDKFIQVKAHTQQEAEEEATRQGLLVSGVYATRPRKPPERFAPREPLLDSAAPMIAEADDDNVGFVSQPEQAAEPFIEPPGDRPTAPRVPALLRQPVAVAYESATTPASLAPQYRGLKIGGRVLVVLATIGYVASVALLIVTAWSLFQSNAYFRSMSWDVAFGYLAAALVPTFTLAAASASMHALGAACIALRDIARNSFRR